MTDREWSGVRPAGEHQASTLCNVTFESMLPLRLRVVGRTEGSSRGTRASSSREEYPSILNQYRLASDLPMTGNLHLTKIDNELLQKHHFDTSHFTLCIHTHTCVVGGQRRGHTVQATLFDMLFYILFDSFRRYGGESHLRGGVHLLRQFTARRRAQRA